MKTAARYPVRMSRRILLALLAAAAAHAGEPAVAFLEGDAGRAAIVDESVEPYFSLLQPMEMATKTGRPLEAKDLAAQRDECRERYRAAIRDFTEGEKAALTALAGKIHDAWKGDYPLFAGTPWSFLKVALPIEGGLPHTRGRTIVLPETLAPFLARLTPEAEPQIAELLVHEQCHVVQRLHPGVFEPLYTGPWGFVRAKGLRPGEALESRQVVNPDGVDMGWVFPVKGGYIQPFLIFSDGKEPRRMPRDFREIAVPVEKDGAGFRTKAGAAPVPLASAREHQERFGAIGQTYHPNEIFACLFSAMVLRDDFGGPGLRAPCEVVGKDFEKLREWCRKHLAGAK